MCDYWLVNKIKFEEKIRVILDIRIRLWKWELAVTNWFLPFDALTEIFLGGNRCSSCIFTRFLVFLKAWDSVKCSPPSALPRTTVFSWASRSSTCLPRSKTRCRGSTATGTTGRTRTAWTALRTWLTTRQTGRRHLNNISRKFMAFFSKSVTIQSFSFFFQHLLPPKKISSHKKKKPLFMARSHSGSSLMLLP